MSRVFGAACCNPFVPASLPSRKSDNGKPVAAPSTRSWPGERTFATESDVQRATLAPTANWWLPRTSVTSSLICQEFVSNVDSLSVPPPSWKPVGFAPATPTVSSM